MEIDKFLELAKKLDSKKKGKKEELEKFRKLFERFHNLNRAYLDNVVFEKAEESISSMAEAIASRSVERRWICLPSAGGSAIPGAARGTVRVPRSLFKMRPPGPVPVICERSIPASAASFRATGDARTPVVSP